MSFVTPDFQEIRDAILRDIVNQWRKNGVAASVGADSDYRIRANATGSAVEGLYQHQAWIARQIFPDRSDSDYLYRHAALRGLSLKAATAASGSISFSGVAGSPIALGVECKTADGIAFLTTASGTVGIDGTVEIAARASAVGVSGNQDADTALTLTAAPAGVSSTAAIATMNGGTNIESDASLLSRLLFLLRNPPCGGAAHDYYSWAMNVAGVTAAYVYPTRRGLGTTDVVVLTEGGIPDAGLVADVQAYIDSVRPVQGEFLALAPTAVPANPGGSLVLASGYSLVDVSAAIDAGQASYFSTLKPGDTAYLKRISAIVSNTAGVVDFALASPLANIATVVDATHTELATLGTPAWTL